MSKRLPFQKANKMTRQSFKNIKKVLSFDLAFEDCVYLQKLIIKSKKSRNQYLRFIVKSWIEEQKWLAQNTN